jgi:hypothetical protein
MTCPSAARNIIITMTAQKLAEQILAFTDASGGSVSFAETGKHVAGFRAPADAQHAWFLQVAPGCLLWLGMTEKGFEALKLAQQADDPLVFVPASPLVYHYDGSAPSLPVAESARAYESDHWLPVTLCRQSYAEKGAR